MRELTVNEVGEVGGAVAPAIYGAFIIINHIRAVYTATQIAQAAGVAAGAGLTVVAATN